MQQYSGTPGAKSNFRDYPGKSGRVGRYGPLGDIILGGRGGAGQRERARVIDTHMHAGGFSVCQRQGTLWASDESVR